MATKTRALGMLTAASISLFLGLISKQSKGTLGIYFTFASMLLYMYLDRYIVKTVSSYNYLRFQSNTVSLL